MKKTYNFLMSVAVAAMAFIGCTNTEISIDNNPAPAPVDGVYRQLTFAADTESDASRTHHTGETIHWSKGDRIRIGYTRDGVWQNAEGRTGAENDKSTAKLYASTEQDSDAELSVFRVTQLFKDTEAKGEIWFYGLYPSEITKRNEPDFSNSETGEINVYIPWIQAPTATSFDPKADLLVSKSRHSYESFPSYDEHIKMVWTRLVAHGQITLKNLLGAGMVEGEKISFVEFTVDEGVNLTGDFTLTLNIADPDQPHMPTITSKSGSKNKVRLSFAENTEYNTLDGEGNFVVWFATAPFTTASLNVKVGTDKAIYTRSIANAHKTFKVNTRSTLGINMASATRSDLELGESWELMTDASVLAEGKKIVIAAADYDVAMSTTQNTNNRAETAITKSETKNTITIDSDVQVLTVGKGTTDGTWSLYDEDKTGYLYAASSSSNHLKTQATLNATGSWTIEVTNTGLATIKSAGRTDTQPGTMRYNATNNPPIFSCYKASNQMKDISIYHNATALEQLAKPVISRLTEVEAKAVLVEWEEVENALYYSIKCQKDGTTTDKGIVIFKNITDTSFVADNLSDGWWNITVTAYGDGYYSNTSDAENIEVKGVTPIVEADPTELTFTSAGGTQTIEVNCNNLGDDVEITAESSNDAFEVSVEDGIVTVTAGANATDTEISGTITITANGTTTVATSVTVKQEAMIEASTEWQLLTDLRSLQTEGLEVVIAAADYDVAMCTTQSDNNRKSAAITKSGNTMSIVGDVQIFQLMQGTTEGTWAFFDDTLNGYLYAASSSNNYLRTQATNNDNGSWTITVTDNVASIVAQGANTRNVMQYNANKDDVLFSCYASASQKAVAIYYRLASTEPRINSVSTDKTEFEHDGSTTINATVVTKYAAGQTLNVTFDGDWVTIDPTTVTVGEDDNTATFALTAAENTANEPRTITMTVSLNGSSKQLTFTQKAAPIAATGWALLTDVNTLKPGMEVVITTNTANRVLGTLSNDEFFTAVSGVTFSNDKSTITALPADAIIFTIGGTTDAYTFSCDSGLLGSSSATKNQWNGDNTTWTLTPNNGNVDIISVGTGGQLQYNTAAPRFKNYTSSQGEVQIYYRGEGSGEFPITPSLTVTPTSLTWEADATEAQQITVTANGEWSHIESGMDWATVSVSGDVITVTPNAANSNEAANEGTITISMAGVNDVVVNCSQAGATQSGGGEGGGEVAGATDYIDREFTGVTNGATNYSEWSGKTGASGAVYAGNSAGSNNTVQLRSNNSNSGIIVTKSAGKVSKVIVTWNSNTADGRTLDIYGKNTAYSAATDLYATNTRGTKLGSIVYGTSTELAIEGDYAFIGLRSNNGAMYLTQIQIVWGDGGESGGDTPATPTQLTMSNVTCTAQTEDSLTFSWSAVTGATGYQVSTDNSNWISPNGNLSHTLSGLTADTQYTLYVKAIGDDTNYTDSEATSASGTTTAASSGGAKTYSFTILPSSFNSTSYAANNNSKTSTATATDGSTMQVSWTSNQVMLQSGVMQWQKSKGYIYNTTDLGTIKSITVNSSAGTFTQYINSSQKPTSNGTGGYFQIKVGSATGYVSSIEVTFEK